MVESQRLGSGSLAQGTFVGRQREMGELKATLEDTLSGQGRLVLLAGEPGIGKTRTAQELATYAETQGAQVLWGRCYEGEGAPPYWPWIQPLRSCLERTGPEQLRSDMGPGASDIGDMLPELREKLPDLESPPALEPEQARFRLFGSVTTFLRNASQRTPLVLVLDDLHWADRSSLLLLHFLAQHLGNSHIMVTGTYRDVEVGPQHLLSETLAQLSREPVFRRQSLCGLSLEDAGRFIEITAGVRPTQQLINAVYTRTEGNPFFTAEVVRLLNERGELKKTEGAGTVAAIIPAGVLEVIGRRLHRLSSQCHQTLTIAAVVGREFDFRLLSILSEGIPEDKLLDVIDEALEAHLIEELPERKERYQFCHALIQETLTQQLSSSRKVRQHARIAQALEELYGGDAEAHAAELAHHFGEAQTLLGPEKLIKYSLLAGEQALASYAWEEALAHFHRGLITKGVRLEGTNPAQDGEAAALLFGLARAWAGTTDKGPRLQETVNTLSRAFDFYAQAGQVDRAVAVAEYPLSTGYLGRTGHAQFVLRALQLVTPDSLAAGRLLSSHGAELGRLENDYDGAQEALCRALAIARREKDRALEVRTLALSSNVNLYHLHIREALKNARQAIDLAPGVDDPQMALLTHMIALRALHYTGGSRAALPHAVAALELAQKLRGPTRLAVNYGLNVLLYRHLGDLRRAREMIRRVLAEVPLDIGMLSECVLSEYESGDFDAGADYLKRFLEAIPPATARPGAQYAFLAQVLPWVARITGGLDQLDAAAAAAQTVLSSPFALPYYALWSRAGLGLVAVLRGDVADATEQYKALERSPGVMLWAMSSDHVLGLLACTMGNLDRAVEHFENVVAFCRKAGYRPALAWSCYDYADLLLSRNGSSDRQQARSLLEEALTVSTELGMRPLMGRVHALWEQAEVQARVLAYPDGLSQREVEVLRLIALGKSNPEIAQELLISSNTVAHHVTNILNKTNTSNRTEAATYAAQHGLI